VADSPGNRPRLIGHRGAAAVAPENTASSLRAGVEAGADLVEFDVRLSADRRPVLLHDADLDRTTNGNGAVCKWQWERLSDLDAGSWFSRKFSGERLIDLDVALQLLRPETGVIVELKSESDEDMPLLETVLKSIETTGGFGGVTVSCKRWPLLRSLSSMAPGVDLALTLGMTDFNDKIGAVALHVNRRRLTGKLTRRAHDAGLLVDTYTVNDPAVLNRVLSLGVDGIFSDDPGKLRSLIRLSRLNPVR